MSHPYRHALLLLSGLLACAGSGAADDVVRTLNDLTLQWTGLEHQKDQLQADWRRDRPILEQQLALLERETAELEALLEQSAQQQDEVEETRLELLREQTRFEQEQAAMERALGRAGERLRALYPQLPPPLMRAWERELPRQDEPSLSLSERLQKVLELLGELDDFQRKLTLDQSVMTLPDGRDYRVEAVYLGVSHGWYVSADGRFAAAGIATPEGWRWTPSPDGPAISRVIAILERRENAELVTLPLRLRAGEE